MASFGQHPDAFKPSQAIVTQREPAQPPFLLERGANAFDVEGMLLIR
jgi:hypothetical protein